MARPKKEKSLIDKALAKEEFDLSLYTLQEIKETMKQLVELQATRIRKTEILKLQEVVLRASEKIKELLEED
ncbi:MAG: hypothetical protein HFJ94_06145 [Muribaculaceae bacterium]|jgi:hypothetical protein|nr:hypothetical protein [Muribaculaceae bacterium]